MCMCLCLCVCGQRGRKEDADVDDGDDEDNKEQDYKQGDRIGPQCHNGKSLASDSCVSSPEAHVSCPGSEIHAPACISDPGHETT
jgi:hypothetical protein